ncbi:hypothetical protein Pla175_27740 [Pirellulimonas nuda]|uniref:Uncharacterized protein n=1 Tax=Pirellulimonas nuda TaxID=2528009 RepID=A0A518DD22_9BACT|nr:hypothetical protein [Pirellulimonas nuda]QDU89384.1 hypothetical protein Pla175_27740 [Pirellulimonas nuda]
MAHNRISFVTYTRRGRPAYLCAPGTRLVQSPADRMVSERRNVVAPLHDADPGRAAQAAQQIASQHGKEVIPALLMGFDPRGGYGHALRLWLLDQLDPIGARRLVEECRDLGSDVVARAATGIARYHYRRSCLTPFTPLDVARELPAPDA